MTGLGDSSACVADVMVTRPKAHGPGASVADIAAFFLDDHVHMALVVGTDGRLLTTIERSDLDGITDYPGSAATVGTVVGRVVRARDPLRSAAERLLLTHRRRLAVIDEAGQLVGLLCLKQSKAGFCSDADVRSRAAERNSQQSVGWQGASQPV